MTAKTVEEETRKTKENHPMAEKKTLSCGDKSLKSSPPSLMDRMEKKKTKETYETKNKLESLGNIQLGTNKF